MTRCQPVLNQLNLAVQDMDATLAFYRRLGLTIDADAGSQHVSVELPTGMIIEFDSTQFVPQWDAGWKGATGGSAVLGFSVPSREAVDDIYADLTGAGYGAHQPPYDAFWGARYAIVDDPDGSGIGLMSPIDEQRKYWPPEPPPTSPERLSPQG
jgi:catechol 2,3-dioxygenase-like lactoylglutathione lyase family enzyme